MGAASMDNSYEQVRKRRVEENKKRMQELGIKDLSKNLESSASKSPISAFNSSAGKKYSPRIRVPVDCLRRSSRVAGVATKPDYREVEVEIRVRRSFGGGRGSRGLPLKYCSQAARFAAGDAAEEVEKGLTSGRPSFVKMMLQSHVSGGFWLGLPSYFCRAHMPRKDTLFVLEDEKGLEWESLYLAYKNGLSGGWRGFSLDHQLQDGDAVVFQLIEPARFKTYIVRVENYEGNKETCLQLLEADTNAPNSEETEYKNDKENEDDDFGSEPIAKRVKWADQDPIEAFEEKESDETEHTGDADLKNQSRLERKQITLTDMLVVRKSKRIASVKKA